ncbi:MAG: cysteine desulfurase DndA [Isosphaeraceae bacterium]
MEARSKMRPLYLDYNATTPLDPRVFEAMKPYFLEEFGNAGSRTHVYGQRAKEAVERARSQVADLIAAKPEEIVFTSGATESNNLALLGLARHGESTGRKHILSTAIEHKAVLEPLDRLRELGFEVELAPVTGGGYVEPDAIRARLRPDTLVVSVMHANNETGVLQPVAEIAELLAETKTLFHIDAAQTFGKEVETLRTLRCDLLSISGHKIMGPKGVGGLYVKRTRGKRVILSPIIHGGGQETGLRPGTLAVPLIAGLGVAAELALREHIDRQKDALRIRCEFQKYLASVDHLVNGDLGRMQSHVMNVSFPGVDSEALMLVLRDSMAISNGSACSAASYRQSHVLTAMGLKADGIASSVRFSWGPGVESVPFDRLVDAIRSLSGATV